jgi:hypothetical protein
LCSTSVIAVAAPLNLLQNIAGNMPSTPHYITNY